MLVVGGLQEMFEEAENALFELQDLQEILDLQNNQLDHRFQLALYKEKKLSELKKLRGKHVNSLTNHITVIIDKTSIQSCRKIVLRTFRKSG